MIKFENVTKVYKEGAKPALDNVSFNIERGEFVFLVGSSGSGKSTMLGLILRELRANSGLIQVAGRDLATLTNWRVPEYRQHIGVVFQNFRLLQNKTVYQNVAFALQVIGKTKREIDKLVPEALELVGLSDKAERYPDQLSGGERQRAAIARAFVNKPLIMLADEPTGNLDPATSADIMRVFDMISKMGTTLIMATHSEDIVNTYTKRVLELRHGKLIRDEENGKYISRIDSLDDDVDDANAIEEPAVPEDLDINETVAIGKIAKQLKTAKPPVITDEIGATNEVNQSDIINSIDNQTVRIAKIPRVNTAKSSTNSNISYNEFGLDTAEIPNNTQYEDFFTANNNDIFHSGAFDASEIRNDLKGGSNEI